MKAKAVDKTFLTIVIVLVILGVGMFFSAALGVLARSEKTFYSIIINQLIFGLLGGFLLMTLAMRIPYQFWRKYAFYIFIGALMIMPLVFIPGLGLNHGGASRWIDLHFVSFQPVEILKIAYIMYLAAWLSWVKQKVSDFRYGILPLIIILGIIATLLFLQPDTKSFILMLVTGGFLLFISGVPMKFFVALLVGGLLALGILGLTTPYVKNRISTFVNPTQDTQGSSYQLQQSLIAFGSGGLFGRGFGQSVQKFGYLPEPHGDSIFAVIGEEFGFLGTTTFIVLYVLFALRGLRISWRAPDQFSRLLSSGIVILLTCQAFLNIASLTGLFPLTGVPLVFVSQGGTSLLFSLFAVGIVLNISRYQKQPNKLS
jgi:cell division protein FtsW